MLYMPLRILSYSSRIFLNRHMGDGLVGVDGVGVAVKDKELKLEEIVSSHTLGGSG
jgi:hypothetical protein